MELAHSLLLNEDALAQVTEAKRPVFIFEWLRFLDKVLVAANKVGGPVWGSERGLGPGSFSLSLPLCTAQKSLLFSSCSLQADTSKP